MPPPPPPLPRAIIVCMYVLYRRRNVFSAAPREERPCYNACWPIFGSLLFQIYPFHRGRSSDYAANARRYVIVRLVFSNRIETTPCRRAVVLPTVRFLTYSKRLERKKKYGTYILHNYLYAKYTYIYFISFLSNKIFLNHAYRLWRFFHTSKWMRLFSCRFFHSFEWLQHKRV